MAGVPRVSVALRDFLESVRQSEELPRHVAELRSSCSGGPSILPRREFEMVVELAFLQLFLAWEEFLEESFIRYLCGSASPSGQKFRRLIKPQSQETARTFLMVNRRYVDWTEPGMLRPLAESMFENGGSFSVLSTAGRALREMRTIRNRIAHRSGSARTAFETLVRECLGYVPKPPLTPGAFLLRNRPTHHATASNRKTPRSTFFSYYSSTVTALANLIAP